MNYDIVIIGAGFAGLSLAYHLPKNMSVLVLDMKPNLDAHTESTGLITEATYGLFEEMIDPSKFVPNKITTIGVVGTDYKKMFFSHTKNPWIYSTSTPALLKHLAENLPKNVHVKIACHFTSYKVHENEKFPVTVAYLSDGKTFLTSCRFIVGADGANSKVALCNKNLSKNKKFLVGMEKVFFGEIKLGAVPDKTVYHFWFGAFSLGYGGWLSPTVIDGKSAFRLGLAKLKKDASDLKKIDLFIKTLLQEKIIEITPDAKEILTFSSPIPIGGPVRNFYDKYSMLIGDAGGFCGAFAADGIKGAIISAKVAAKLIPAYLDGDTQALKHLHKNIEMESRLMTYYRKQLLYRFLWNRMNSNRSFDLLFEIISRQKETFLQQFCDSKDRNKSLVFSVLRLRNLPLLFSYAFSLFLDLFDL